MKTDKKIDFSVVITCYNSDIEKLKKTIISCHKQKCVNFEIVISDDGSKVSCENQLRKWAESLGITLVYNFLPQNVGTIGNLISGVKCSKGKYILSLAPGDYLSDEYALNKYCEKYKAENADIVFSNGIFYNGETIFYKERMPFFKSTCDKKMKKNIFSLNDAFLGASLSFERSLICLLEEVNEKVKLIEDTAMMFLAILNNKKIVLIDDPLVWYEVNCNTSPSAARSMDVENLVEYIKRRFPREKIINTTIGIKKDILLQGIKRKIHFA